MKSTLLALCLISPAVFAQVNNLEVRTFNFQYQNPQGSGVAQVFSFERDNDRAEQRVEIEKINEEFKIVLTGVENQEFIFKNAPETVLKAETMNVANLNLVFQDRAAFSVSDGSFIAPESSMSLKGISLDCDRDKTQALVMDQALSGCVQKMTLKAASFMSRSDKLGVTDVFTSALNRAVNHGFDEVLDEKGVKNLDLRATAGKFEFTTEIKASISGKIKGNGSLSYNSTTGILTVKIDSVKYGILPITSQVFDELKKNESEKVKVQKPYVYITVR